jgi:hypothetical protein
MMKRTWWVLLIAAVPALGAQGRARMPDSTRAAELRAQVERRFAEHVRRELDLSDDQATKLRATQERYAGRRRAQMQRQQEIRRALDDQMQPGVAANADSVRRLMDALQAGRGDMLKLEQEEDREMAGYLSPVQRARFQTMRERFVQRVQQLRRERGRGGFDRPRRRPDPGARQPGRRPA